MLGDRDVVGDAVAAPRPLLEVAGREEREVGRHRLDGAPVRGGAAVPLPLETRTPLATTSFPRGTVIRMSNDALSRGWSLAGNHQAAMCGSFMVTTSLSLASQLLSPCEVSVAGTPAYLT